MHFSELKKQRNVHFIGIGGIGMSALAMILKDFGIAVQGSDIKESYITEKLKSKEVGYHIPHSSSNIDDSVSLVVKTSIIRDDNPEIIEAKRRDINIITRAQLLAVIMTRYQSITVAGTHGKTSTTAMVSLILEAAGLDPTVINGGVINYFGSNSKIGLGSYLVAESDESDGSFVDLPTTYGIITNIEPEHLEFDGYAGSFERQKAYFRQYVNQIPEYGMCAICIDDVNARELYNELKDIKSNLLSYSIKSSEADLFAKSIVVSAKGISFDVVFANGDEITNITMEAYGEHNISNALASILVAKSIGVNSDSIKLGLLNFTGVKRRFTKIGKYCGATVIDDYGHHPTEIVATLKAARVVAGLNKVVCVFEPHKFTRVRDLFDQFCLAFEDADIVVVSDIYHAGQTKIEGVSQDLLIEGIKNFGHKEVIKMEDSNQIPKIIKPLVKEGDIILFTGAGNASCWAGSLIHTKN